LKNGEVPNRKGEKYVKKSYCMVFADWFCFAFGKYSMAAFLYDAKPGDLRRNCGCIFVFRKQKKVIKGKLKL
jgi:hypothetical protein